MAAQRVGNLIGYVGRSVKPGVQLRATLPRRRQLIGSLLLRHCCAWPELRASRSPTRSSSCVLLVPQNTKVDQADKVRPEQVSLVVKGARQGSVRWPVSTLEPGTHSYHPQAS